MPIDGRIRVVGIALREARQVQDLPWELRDLRARVWRPTRLYAAGRLILDLVTGGTRTRLAGLADCEADGPDGGGGLRGKCSTLSEADEGGRWRSPEACWTLEIFG